jgi:hypothetical protein
MMLFFIFAKHKQNLESLLQNLAFLSNFFQFQSRVLELLKPKQIMPKKLIKRSDFRCNF